MKSYLICFITLIISVICSGCERKETPEPIIGSTFSGNLNMRVTSQSGDDLLEPTNPKAFKKFIVSYLVDGKKKYYGDGGAFQDNTGGYVIEKYPLDSFYHLKIFVAIPKSQNTNDMETVTLLEFEDGSIDTIRATFEERPNYLVVVKGLYNSLPAWDYYKNNGNMGVYELIKP